MLEVILRGELVDEEGETRFVQAAVQAVDDDDGEDRVDFRLIDDEIKGNLIVDRDELTRALHITAHERAIHRDEPGDA